MFTPHLIFLHLILAKGQEVTTTFNFFKKVNETQNEKYFVAFKDMSWFRAKSIGYSWNKEWGFSR